MSKKQTAVEWLIQRLHNRRKGIFDGLPVLTVQQLCEKAIIMEREQIVSFCYDFIPTIQVVDNETVFTQLPEEIYNKTYGKEAGHES